MTMRNTFAVGGIALSIGLLVLSSNADAQSLFGTQPRYGFHQPNLFYLRAALIAVSGIAGFGLGWFLSPQAAPLRRMILIGVLGLLAVIAIVDNGVMGWGLSSFMAMIAFAIGLGYWLRPLVERLRERPTSFGSARWANLDDLNKQKLLGSTGLSLGYVYDQQAEQHAMRYHGDRHLLTIAPNRSGKGTTAIIPNLLQYQGSIVVIDPKGENAMITAKQRQAMGHDVLVVDPMGITGMKAARLNPLDWLSIGDIEIGDNAMLLADSIIRSEGGDDPFWNEEAKALLRGVMLHVATDPSEDGQRHLGRVRDLLLLDGEDMKALFTSMLQSPLQVVRSTAARSLQKEAKLLSNVLASVQAQTHFLDSPRLRENLAHSDFDFADLKHKPMTIYLILPSDKLNSHGSWLRLLIQQALSVNARNIECQPDQPVLFLLDELPALGRLTMVEQAYGLMAGYGMQLWGIAQDASQLKRIYGDGWETFISNAGVLQYFGSRDQMTADYFSALCGVTTVWNASTALARAFGQTSGGNSSSTSTTITHTDTATGSQRKLAYPDELMRMDEARQLLLVENGHPIMGSKLPWFQDPKLKELGVNLHAQADAKAGQVHAAA
ncbi:type IV secretory system conjugative DNA transfer family protein [Phaeobacter piscinae]|uniref:Type IV secretory pathway, VirD4 component n=1 Tax=Phaeobacter piscinae TaxID=1580596 RepID=A0AAN1GR40_9RHOB|nr:type IV secretory system conjugative DNA transfer family protein [Phaeobacter piscinae]ATG43633.1 putative protein VirD4 [Phaeobacter piscinae]